MCTHGHLELHLKIFGNLFDRKPFFHGVIANGDCDCSKLQESVQSLYYYRRRRRRRRRRRPTKKRRLFIDFHYDQLLVADVVLMLFYRIDTVRLVHCSHIRETYSCLLFNIPQIGIRLKAKLKITIGIYFLSFHFVCYVFEGEMVGKIY